jgi:hypothetical protein
MPKIVGGRAIERAILPGSPSRTGRLDAPTSSACFSRTPRCPGWLPGIPEVPGRGRHGHARPDFQRHGDSRGPRLLRDPDGVVTEHLVLAELNCARNACRASPDNPQGHKMRIAASTAPRPASTQQFRRRAHQGVSPVAAGTSGGAKVVTIDCNCATISSGRTFESRGRFSAVRTRWVSAA